MKKTFLVTIFIMSLSLIGCTLQDRYPACNSHQDEICLKTKGKIPCHSDDDCTTENMINYCNPDFPIIFKCVGAKYYCEKGYCKVCDCPTSP